MINFLQKITVYKAPITNTTPDREITVKDVYMHIIDEALKSTTDEYRKKVAKARLDPKKKDEAKRFKLTKFDCATFAGTFSKRQANHLTAPSGLMCLDLDHVAQPDEVAMVRQKIYELLGESIALMFTSPSGDGIKVVVTIDLSKADFQTWFVAYSNYLEAKLGLKTDPQCKDVSRACFLPYDANCYIHPDYFTECAQLQPPAELDPKEWAGTDATTEAATEPRVQPLAPTNAPTPFTPIGGDDLRAEVLRLAHEVVSRGIDLTTTYEEWTKVGFALAHNLGESGRDIFHTLSCQHPNYKYDECDRKYTQLLAASPSSNPITIKTLFQMAKDFNIPTSTYSPHPVPDAGSVAPFHSSECVIKGTMSYVNNEEIDENSLKDEIMSYVIKTFMTQQALSEEEARMQAKAYYFDSKITTFSDKLPVDFLCPFVSDILDKEDTPQEKDKMLLGAITLISGVLGNTMHVRYHKKINHAPFFTIVFGPSGSGKGDLQTCLELVNPIIRQHNQEYRQALGDYEHRKSEWDSADKKTRGEEPKEPQRRSFLIPVDNTHAAFARQLDANGGLGTMFDTEGSALASAWAHKDYGNYSELFRRAWSNELYTCQRQTEHLNIYIEKPALAVMLTCTGTDIPKIMTPEEVANGLASRFVFYQLQRDKISFSDVWADEGERCREDVYKDLGKQVKYLYDQLLPLGECGLQFMLTPTQQQVFREIFQQHLVDTVEEQGDTIYSAILRLAGICVRIAMVLTMLRRLSERYPSHQPLIDPSEKAILCNERDFYAAVVITYCLLHHTKDVYSVVARKQADPFANMHLRSNNPMADIYKGLPSDREFSVDDIVACGRVQKRQAQRIVKKLHETNLIKQTGTRPTRYVKLQSA